MGNPLKKTIRGFLKVFVEISMVNFLEENPEYLEKRMDKLLQKYLDKNS